MSQSFDPYHIWLGIRPEEQPPNHYRLLGIALSEDNTEAIRDAAVQRMAHVRTYQLGPHSALSQQILNELAAAKACLMDAKKKAAYDDRLRAQAVEDSPPPASRPLGSPNKRVLALAGVGVAVVLFVAVVLIVAVSSRKGGQPDETRPRTTPPVAKSSTTKDEGVDADSNIPSPQPPTEQVVAKDMETPQPKPAEVASTPAMAPAATPSPEPPPTTTSTTASSAESLPQARTRLEKALKEAKTPSEFQSLGSEALLLAERAFEAGDKENGKAIATVAVAASRTSGDSDLMRKAALVFIGGDSRAEKSVHPNSTSVAGAGMPRGKIRLLILSGANFLPFHDWRVTTPILQKMYEGSGLFITNVTEDVPALAGNDFAKYDAIVSNYTNHPNRTRWPASTEKAFLDYIAAGHGFVLFHAANTAWADWTEFQNLVGLSIRRGESGHAKPYSFAVNIVDKEHPITEGMRDFQHVTDELFHRQVKHPTAHVLATAYSDRAMKGSGEYEPVVVVTEHGKGRVFYNTLGHGPEAMEGIGWQTLMLRGTEWAATGKVTIPIPPK